MWTVVVASLLSFVATEIDDFVMLLVLFSNADRASKKAGVITGKYLAVIFMVTISIFFSLYLERFSSKVLGLMGFIPLFIGIFYHHKKQEKKHVNAVLTVASFFIIVFETFLITLGNSADNFSIYIPFFASLSGAEFYVMGTVFFVCQCLVCFAAIKVVNSEAVQVYLKNYSKTIISIAFILLGLYILIKNGTVVWLFNLARHRT